MRGYLLYFIYITIFFVFGCNSSIKTEKKLTGKTVEIILKDGKYSLYRHGKPFYIKGASGTSNLDLLKEIGGNSFRTYTTENAQELLDKAQELGLTVMLGVWIEPYSVHNDLTDTNFTKRTLRFIEREVNRYKDHPALLMWGLGNEVHPINPNISSWKFLDKACKLVKELDPNHPVTTSLAGYPRRNITLMNMYLKSADFVSFNTFGGIRSFNEKRDHIIWGYDGPYLFSEWGNNGYWEKEDKTKWSSTIEKSFSKKATRLNSTWRKFIYNNNNNSCIGSYIFYWGQKQEYTSSWYSMFSKEGEKTIIIDSLADLWSNDKVANFSPTLKKLQWFNNTNIKNIKVKPSELHNITLEVYDLENDSLSLTAEIRNETSVNIDDFGNETEPVEITGLVSSISLNKINFKAPPIAGLYRIYLKLSDNKGGCDMVNIPFKVY